MTNRSKKSTHSLVMLRLVAFAVFVNGLLITLGSLDEHVVLHKRIWQSSFQISLAICIGVSLIYLSTLLSRRKRTAWLVTMCVYAFTLAANVTGLLLGESDFSTHPLSLARHLFLPLVIVGALLYYSREFYVRSDTQSFAQSLRRAGLVLFVALLYGVIGFHLLDKRDFHQNITLAQSIQYTIDQFGLTTTSTLKGYSPRGNAFLDSLSIISTLSVGYAFLALFQPLKARLADQTANRALMQRILASHSNSSEDFFKLWPHDKSYLFSDDHKAGLAYHVTRGVALCVGDPVGPEHSQANLMERFLTECEINDWLPSFILTGQEYSPFYRQHQFSVQKIGEEAIIPIDNFLETKLKDKYFRQIVNKFEKQGYTTQMLEPPHSNGLLRRLKEVSDSWLSLPGRDERGIMMGYFSDDYLQRCPVMVLRDDAGTIQAFINQVAQMDKVEANYDMLRQTTHALSNSNDFLLINFMLYLHAQGFKQLNMGLCPLAGIGEAEGIEQSRYDAVIKFVYTNGDRIYSFSGLHKFKTKYDPQWKGRYLAYKGGVRGLTRTLRALTRAMKR